MAGYYRRRVKKSAATIRSAAYRLCGIFIAIRGMSVEIASGVGTGGSE
jgi:hypothetical protein